MKLIDLEKLKKLIHSFPISHSKHAILNSFNHLKKAKEIANVDYKMAYFRSLTAMEEVSSGLILGLKMEGYQKVSSMNYRQHYQKFLFYNYFLLCFCHFIRTVSDLNPKFHIENTNEDKNSILYLHLFDAESEKMYTPIPPFNNYIGKRNNPSDLNSIFKEKYAENIIDNIINSSTNLCSQRNQLLYASQKGISNFDIDFDKYFSELEKDLILLSCVWVTIIQSEEQLFIHQIFDSFKEIMSKIKDDDSIEKLIEENYIAEGEFHKINVKLA